MRLHESKPATADANGRAVATLQPLRAFEKWKIRRMTVTSTSTPLVPTVKVYRGSETPSNLIDGTFTGTMDHSDTDIDLENGEAILAVWSGANVAASCVFTVEGEIRGR